MARRERPPGARPLRPLQLVLVVVVVVAALAVGDRLLGSGDEVPGASRVATPRGSASPDPGDRLGGEVTDANRGLSRCTVDAAALARCGTAPALDGVSRWFNDPGGAGIDLAALRGHVVLVDFFSYSCGACLRDQSYLTRWDTTYARAGLRVIGVQSPQWDFERDAGNVAAGVRDLGIDYPVGLDPDRTSLQLYRGTTLPAKYLIDAHGTVRAIGFGASDYERTETQIRELLQAARPAQRLPRRSPLLPPDENDGLPAQIIFGNDEQSGYTGGPRLMDDREAAYAFAARLEPSQFTLSGRWTSTAQYLQAGRDARLRISFAAMRASVVAAGTGRLRIEEAGRPTRTVRISGRPGSVVLFTGRLDLGAPVTFDVTPGLRLYALNVR